MQKHNHSLIIEKAKSGITPKEISESLQIPYPTIGGILRQYGFKYRPVHNNIRYFQNIDSHTKAYFLGFIAADGCLQSNGYNSIGLTITIHNKDIFLLEKLKKELQSTVKILHLTTKMSYTNKNKNHNRLAIFNKDLYNDIFKWGITPRKSLTMPNIIPNIPQEYRKSFILGYFDGDGCVMFQNQIKIKNNKECPTRGLTILIRGTKEFLSGIVSELNIENYSISFDKTHKLSFSKKKEIVKFFSCYYNTNIFLPRKRDRFLEKMSHKSWNKLIQVQTISLPQLVL